MNRYTTTMRHDHLDLLLCSKIKELRNVLHCPDMTHDTDLKRHML